MWQQGKHRDEIQGTWPLISLQLTRNTSRSLVLPIRKMQQSNLPLTGNGHSFFVKSFVEIPLNAF